MKTLKNHKACTVFTGAIIAILIFNCFCVFAATESPSESEDFFDMSLEQLADEPYVVSASRQAQLSRELTVPVTVITAEDIHYSGLTSIPEILNYATGVDVLRIDRTRYAVGVRGHTSTVSDRTLVLLNGRTINNPAFGGVDWQQIPVLLEDIERIEVVRGPAGATWGSNAFTGMINIITKKPKDVLGYFGSTTINEFGDSYTHVRVAQENDKLAWKLSAGYEDIETSDDAGAGRYKTALPAFNPDIATYEARDFARNYTLDTEAVYDYSASTQLSAGGAYSYREFGDYEFLSLFEMRDCTQSTARVFTKIDHDFGNGTTGYLQWNGRYIVTHLRPWLTRYSVCDNDIEGQLNFKLNGVHDITLGGNLRWTRLGFESPKSTDTKIVCGEPIDEQWAGFFVMDRYKLTDRTTLEGQVRTDWYSETHADWAARATALYALDDAHEHVLRFSAAKAYRAPSAGLRSSTITRFYSMVNVIAPYRNLRNEETYSLEFGYRGKITRNLSLNADAYYQRFTHLIGGITSYLGGMTAQIDNIDGGNSYGAEVELALQTKAGKFSAWYAYNEFETDLTGQNIRAFYPADNKAGISWRTNLLEDLVLNTNYSYDNGIKSFSNGLADIEARNYLDVTISKPIADGNGEIMIGLANLLNETMDVVLDTGQFASHETPGRTLFARVQLKF